MPIVSAQLLDTHTQRNELIAKAVKVLEEDEEVKCLLKMSNVMAVTRLGYNDHGPVHARIVTGTALEIYDILVRRGIKPTTLKDNITKSIDESKLVVVFGAYLHDIGNSIHRSMHELVGILLAKDILDRLLPMVIKEKKSRLCGIRQEILHTIYSTQYDLKCLTMEAGVVKIADGLDMSEGRARIPYKLGKIDMHSMSALSVKYVEIKEGKNRPLEVIVEMDDFAGLFQIEEVLLPKIQKSGLEKYIEVIVYSKGEKLTTYPR